MSVAVEKVEIAPVADEDIEEEDDKIDDVNLGTEDQQKKKKRKKKKKAKKPDLPEDLSSLTIAKTPENGETTPGVTPNGAGGDAEDDVAMAEDEVEGVEGGSKKKKKRNKPKNKVPGPPADGSPPTVPIVEQFKGKQYPKGEKCRFILLMTISCFHLISYDSMSL